MSLAARLLTWLLTLATGLVAAADSAATSKAASEPAVGATVDFDTEIIPVLTKAGCNAGACHGAAAGRGGFHLSLLGADPAADHEAIVLALEGRRVNLADPARSLIIAKPGGQLEHGGDVVLPPESDGQQRMLTWIRSGARRNAGRNLNHFEVSPQQIVVDELPAKITLRAIARFGQESPEEVTPFTVFTSTDPAAVSIDSSSVAEVRRRGQHVVIARFLDRVVPLQITVPLSDRPVDLANEPRASFIDDEVLSRLTQLRLPVSPPASDAAWLRRLTLDLTGRLPTPETTAAWLSDDSADKRQRIVDSLLSSDDFAEYWTLRFARRLRLRSLPNEPEAAQAYAGWIREQIAADRGLDRMARQLITATGDSHRVGPANFARMVPDARGQAELFGQFFLGVRLGCANCHNHPLDRWTQDDYHGLAAAFARLRRGRIVSLADYGAVSHPLTLEPATPRIPGLRDLAADADHRAELADWVTTDKDRRFAKAIVNRLWRAMFGRGLIEPVDDLSETNPATHPELLDRLADDFVANGFRLRHTLRLIALSQTYARSGQTVAGNETDDRFYSRSYRRPLEAEVLADAIGDVTGVATRYDGPFAGIRAVGLVDSSSPAPSLDLLGRCTVADGCETGPATEQSSRGLAAQLHLINGDLINAKLTDEAGTLRRSIAAGESDEAIVTHFYLAGLGRYPSDRERVDWQARIHSDDPDERRRRLEDFVWGLLNSQGFTENH